MVNYCCIQSCNRNSRIHKHLNFYSLPKEKHRQKQWLKLGCRDDLLNKDMVKLRRTIRFCSRHFPPNCVINRHLSPDALPTKSLPGSLDEDEPDIGPARHEGIICDSCKDPILGFRYKCVTCDNFDLCQKCEMLERHSQHYMLRIPKSIRFLLADDLLNKWRNLFKSEHVTPDRDSSSDDEPVTKYMRDYDSGVELSEDVKNNIKNEVARVLAAIKENTKASRPVKVLTDKTLKRKENVVDIVPNKKGKLDDSIPGPLKPTQTAPELVFADVNAVKYDQDVKPETSPLAVTAPNPAVTDETQPLLYVTLSNDLSQFMIELTNENNGNESSMIQ